MQGFQYHEALPGVARMIKEKPRDQAASIRQRLLNLSKERNEDFSLTITRYGLERLLYRLGKSKDSSHFVLKGAMLFSYWTENPTRATRDLDLLGLGASAGEKLRSVFQRVCQLEVEPDGLVFDAQSVLVNEIREGQEYGGQRVKLLARLGVARIPLQVDVGIGDVIFPKPKKIKYPTILQLPAPEIFAYSKEAVVAEKFEAMVKLGMLNSRMKDFYDVWMMAKTFSFDGKTLCRAIQLTFERRKTKLPDKLPIAFSEEFEKAKDKQVQWKAFLHRAHVIDSDIELGKVTDLLRSFLSPLLRALANKTPFNLSWNAKGMWTKL